MIGQLQSVVIGARGRYALATSLAGVLGMDGQGQLDDGVVRDA